MKMLVAFYLLCMVAAAIPLVQRTNPPAAIAAPVWPARYQEQALVPVPLTDAERKFYADFPGHVARFTGARTEYIFRSVASATRKLHPAAHCFRALGFSVLEEPPHRDDHGALWSTFMATRGAHEYRVRERITSARGEQAFTDASSWYWGALLHPGKGPWLSVTIAERVR